MSSSGPEPRIRLYTSAWCGYCARAKALLDEHGLEYEEIDIGGSEGCCRLHELTGGDSVPQAVVDGIRVGGYEQLAGLLRSGALAASAALPQAEAAREDPALRPQAQRKRP